MNTDTVVMKFGGTSLGILDRIQITAKHIARASDGRIIGNLERALPIDTFHPGNSNS